jgi:hypothetical protein
MSASFYAGSMTWRMAIIARSKSRTSVASCFRPAGVSV